MSPPVGNASTTSGVQMSSRSEYRSAAQKQSVLACRPRRTPASHQACVVANQRITLPVAHVLRQSHLVVSPAIAATWCAGNTTVTPSAVSARTHQQQCGYYRQHRFQDKIFRRVAADIQLAGQQQVHLLHRLGPRITPCSDCLRSTVGFNWANAIVRVSVMALFLTRHGQAHNAKTDGPVFAECRPPRSHHHLPAPNVDAFRRKSSPVN